MSHPGTCLPSSFLCHLRIEELMTENTTWKRLRDVGVTTGKCESMM